MDNLDKLLEAIEHPENFSTEELTQILSDPETHKLYNLLCATRGQDFSRPYLSKEDVEHEWEKLKRNNKKRSFLTWFVRKKAAAVIILSLISCSIVAVGVSIQLTQSEKKDADSGHFNSTQITSTVHSKNIELNNNQLNDTIIIFENEKLDVILNKISPYYNINVDLNSPYSKEVRLFLKWDSTMSIDELIDHLNTFDRITLSLNDSTLTDY